MDFYKVVVQESTRRGDDYDYKVYPKFNLIRSKDILVRGGMLWGFWNKDKWNNSEYDLYRMIDEDIFNKIEELKAEFPNKVIIGNLINDSSTNLLKNIRQYYKDMEQLNVDLDSTILFADHKIKREDYATFKLHYIPEKNSTPFFDAMFTKLYEPEELEKILWILGCALTGRTKEVSKMLYLFGEKGSGKGTVLDLIKDMLVGYYTSINLGELIGRGAHGTEQVRNSPMLIDEDSDVSKGVNLENLMKMVSHEPIMINPKGKTMYPLVFDGLILTASNKVIKMPNIDHGMVRRPLIVHPSSRRHDYDDYLRYKEGMKFEHAYIAYRAIEVFNTLGPSYYDDDNNTEMLMEGNLIHAFVEENYMLFKNGVSLNQAAELYKLYLEDYALDTQGYKRDLKVGLTRYFETFSKQKKINGKVIKNYYEGFKNDKVMNRETHVEKTMTVIDTFTHEEDLLKKLINKNPAQYANDDGFPTSKWSNTSGQLFRIDTSKLHYTKLEKNHIVIDFDIKKNGVKNLNENIKAASVFPETYGEISKSGAGIHLHYIYEGDVNELASIYSEDIEIKVFKGNASLRRMFTKSNGINKISTISGLPVKEKGATIMLENFDITEKILRTMIIRNLNKEYHSSTASSVNYIEFLVQTAIDNKIEYDVSDLKSRMIMFAMQSSNQSKKCVAIINGLQLKTELDETIETKSIKIVKDSDIVFYDIEVKPNFLLVCYGQLKPDGSIPHPDDIQVMINPEITDIEDFLLKPIAAFNNRRYDNHILFGRMLGESLYEVYCRSKQIINNIGGLNQSAYNISYVDIYDYTSKKQSLSKWEVELGLEHVEYTGDWDAPIEESEIPKMVRYCKNDVIAEMHVFKHTYADYEARCMISEISGLDVNKSTATHVAKILFGNDKKASESFVYTDLSKEFPGYTFDGFKSSYKGEDPSEGGYVNVQVGYYENVPVLDIKSMHPNSLIQLNYFGKYTPGFAELVKLRVLIKEGKLDEAKLMFGGKLAEYVDRDPKKLAYSLKIVINIIYGMTSARFSNPFKHPDNRDNIIAKRGALFMIDLNEELDKKGNKPIHTKTDSVKLHNPSEDIIKFVFDYGIKYGYEFDLEDDFEKIWLVNKAIYVGKIKNEPDPAKAWKTVGAQFQQPYIRKKIFTQEPIELDDLKITKSVRGKIFMNDEYVGKVVSIYPSKTGYDVIREGDNNSGSVTGTKGYLWREDKDMTKEDIDMTYFKEAYDSAQKTLDNLMA